MRTLLLLSVSFGLGLLGCEPATLTAGDDVAGAGRDPFLPSKNPNGGGGVTPGPGGGGAEAAPPAAGGGGGQRQAPPPAAPQPTLLVEAPARGARALGNSLRVQGRVEHAGSPTVEVNGVAAEVQADGRFIADVPVPDGLAVLVTTLQDGSVRSEDHRAVLINADQDPGTEVADAIKLTVSAEGFRTITRLLSSNLGNLDLGALLGGAGGGGNLEVRSITYNRVEIALEPDFGALKLRLAVHGLRIDVARPMQVVASADPATITAFIELIPDGFGSMTLRIRGSDVALANFDFDLDFLPGFFEELIDWPVRELAEDLLKDALNDVVMPNLFDPAALNQELDLLGMKLNLGLAIDQVFVDPSGLTIGLAASAMPAVVQNPGKAVRPLPGPDGAVEPSELDIALAGGFVNRILHAAWASGALDLQIGGENSAIELPLNLTAALLLVPLAEAGQGISPQAPIEIRTRGLLPPVCTLLEGDRPLHIEVGDFLLDLAAEGEVLVTLAVDLNLDLGIAFDENGELKLDFELTTHVDVAEEPRGKVNAAALEGLVGGILSQLPSMLANGLAAEDAEPMPAAPINLADPRFLAVGAFLHILADIDANPIAPQPVP
ncbi:MAG: hypothetical protein R3F60_31625 [bacterium]